MRRDTADGRTFAKRGPRRERALMASPGSNSAGPFGERFLEICNQRSDVQVMDERILLKIPQDDHAGDAVDSVDRVVVGAELVRDLVDAGL